MVCNRQDNAFSLSTGDLQSSNYLGFAAFPAERLCPNLVSLLRSVFLEGGGCCVRRLSATFQEDFLDNRNESAHILLPVWAGFSMAPPSSITAERALLGKKAWEECISWKHQDRVCVCVCVIKPPYACNQSRREGREAADMSETNIHMTWIFLLLTIQKYNSTIVNLGLYISLRNRENCNKCISAFVYTIFDLSSYTNFHSFLFFSYGIDRKWKCWHKTCMFSASSKCRYLKVESMRYIESLFEDVHVNELTDVDLPPIQTKNKSVGVQPDWVESHTDRSPVYKGCLNNLERSISATCT